MSFHEWIFCQAYKRDMNTKITPFKLQKRPSWCTWSHYKNKLPCHCIPYNWQNKLYITTPTSIQENITIMHTILKLCTFWLFLCYHNKLFVLVIKTICFISFRATFPLYHMPKNFLTFIFIKVNVPYFLFMMTIFTLMRLSVIFPDNKSKADFFVSCYVVEFINVIMCL